ncbi:MAG: pyridoxamine 5'-phosphate oxidase family protein [Thermodesulfobacteriota bacterium]
MRHPERKLKVKETVDSLLKRSFVGRIATINRDGFPVIKPLHFLYEGEKIYFHSSKKGEKIEDIRRGSPLCFEVDQFFAYRATQESPCKAHSYYRSVIIKGKGSLIKDKEKKRKILKAMMEKYQPEGGYGEISEDMLNQTVVIEMSVQEITGKEKLG